MTKKHEVLVIGELNVDLILNHIEDFPRLGTDRIAREMELTMGSSSAIFACNLSVLGADVAFLGITGTDDFGNLILNTFKTKKVFTEYIIRSEKYRTGATIALNYGNDRAMVTYPGAMEHLNGTHVTTDILGLCRHVHISSVFLQPGVLANLESILQRAKISGITTSLDTQWDPGEKWDLDLSKILPLVDVFLPNDDEFLAITGRSDIDSAIESVREYANTIVVKMGAEGSLGYRKGEKIQVNAFPNETVVDAIGAGDSFNAGFILKFLQHADLEQCLRFGSLAGAINTTGAGGTTAFENLKSVRKIAREKFNFQL